MRVPADETGTAGGPLGAAALGAAALGLTACGRSGDGRDATVLPPASPAVEVAPGLRIHPRSAWGSDLPPRGPMAAEEAKFLLVHHTASSNVVPDPRQVIRQTYAFHTGPSRRWPDICYHFMIGPDGSVWETRAGSLAGPVVADATGGNQGFAQLVCLIGDFSVQPPTAAAQDSLMRLLIHLADRYGIDTTPGATTTFVSRGSNKFRRGTMVTTRTVSGHRDVTYTACPGDVGYTLIDGWRTRVHATRLMRSDAGPSSAPFGSASTSPEELATSSPSPTWPEPTDRPSLTVVTASHHPTTHLYADVVVVGAGPAGAEAAVELRRSGRSVVVLDKAVFPRDKCCGDGLTTLALRELDHLGLDPGAISDWFDVGGAAIRSPSGREVFVPLPTNGKYAAVAPRLQLDDALVGLAREHGADIRDGHGFQRLDEHDDHVTVTADGLTIDARYVIAADGMWSPVRKGLGLGETGYLGEWHGFRQYARNVSGPAAHQLYVWFEPDLVPGYAWSFPLPDGRANIGFGVLRDGSRKGAEMKELWAALLQRPHIVEALGAGFELEDRHTAWPIPARIDEAVLTSGRVLFAGDAAMATDVMTGEGIGQALLTGRLAAEALIAAGALQPALAAAHYRRSVRHHLVADHRMSLSLGRVLATSWGARGAIRVVDASGEWGRRHFARWMFEDEPRAVVLTPSRWHRRFLDQPGAYV